jgi:predicted GNAT family N-acyltransferase
MKIQRVEVGSDEWKKARELRYKLFFEETPHDESIMDDEFEKTSIHMVYVEEGEVLAYGRLTDIGEKEYVISQMVVKSTFQSKGLGSEILQNLLNLVGNNHVSLSARLPAVDFYKKFGFSIVGSEFVTPSTGVAHIKMVKNA